MFKTFLPVLLCGVAFFSPQAAGWRGVRPLHSTREQVEQVTGPPLQKGGATYDLAEERVTIVYADGRCAEGWPYGWNVPPGTVISITAYQKTKPSLATLQIDLSRYEKGENPANGNALYDNETEGVSIEATVSGEVVAITYSPAGNGDPLRCPEAMTREAEIRKGESAYLKPALSYSDLPPGEEKRQLDYFAELLRERGRHSKAYVIGYAGRHTYPKEVQTHLECITDYLVKKQGLDPQQLTAIDGGYSDGVRVELYLLKQGDPKPLASPNIYPGDVQTVDDGGKPAAHRRSPRPACY